MDPAVLIPVLAALAGALVGGFVAEARVWVEHRRERRRVLNQVLFHQLGVLRWLYVNNYRTFLEQYSKLIANRLGGSPEKIAESLQAVPQLREAVFKLLDEIRQPDFEKEYQNAVRRLSPVEPVLAHRLSARGALTKLRKGMDAYLEVAAGNLKGQDATMVEMAQKLVDGSLFQIATERVEEDLLLLAGEIGRGTVQDVEERISKLAEAPEIEEEPALQKFLDDLVGVAGKPQESDQVVD